MLQLLETEMRSREKLRRFKRPHNRNSVHVECESKREAGNNRGERNHFKITQPIPEQHIGKARN